MNLRDFLGKVRPQIFLSLAMLGIIALVSIRADMTEIAACNREEKGFKKLCSAQM